MSLASLESVLEMTAAQIKPEQPHYLSLFEENGITPKRALPHWIIRPVQKEIEATPELSEFAKRHSARRIAKLLVHRLFDGIEPKQLIADILDLSLSNEWPKCTYVGLYGGGISGEIQLDEFVIAMPADKSPRSAAREFVFGIDRDGREIVEFFHPPRWRPNIALLIFEKTKNSEAADETDSTQPQVIYEKIQRSIQALTLASGHPFVSSWQTSWIMHPAIPYEGFGGLAASGSFDQIPLGGRSKDTTAVDPKLAREVYLQLAEMPPAIERQIRLATDRLKRSRVHHPSADTVIDLGIAGEIILLHNPGSTGELSYQFAVNGACLLGTDETNRKKTFETLRALYGARSKAVHEGTIKPAIIPQLPDFDLLCSRIIRCILAQQQFPDWNQLVLGDKQATQTDAAGLGGMER